MSYEDKKSELLNKCNLLLRKYYSLLKDSVEFSHELISMEVTNTSETIDLLNFMIKNEDLQKATRLMAALSYVENPQDKEVIANLKENILINKRK